MKVIGTLDWLKMHGNEDDYYQVNNDYITDYPLPKSIYDKTFWLYEKRRIYKRNGEFVAKIKDCVVDRHGAVHTHDGYVLKESSFKHSSIDQSPVPIRAGRACVTIGNLWADVNYYHWLFNSIQRIGLLGKVPRHHDSLIMKDIGCILSNYGDTPYHQSGLKIIDQSRYNIFNLKKYPVHCSELYLPSLTNAPSVNQRICDFLKTNKRVIGKGVRRIYSKRTNKRCILNNDEVEKLLVDKYNFEVIENHKMSVAAQEVAYAMADVIVGVHGANLANIVHTAKRNTKLLEIHNPNFVGLCYWHMSQYCNIDYHYLMGEGKISTSEKDYQWKGNCNQNITVDINKLEDSLKLMGL